MRDGEGHPGIQLPAMLGRKERRGVSGCVRVFTFRRVFSLCFHPQEKWDELPVWPTL